MNSLGPSARAEKKIETNRVNANDGRTVMEANESDYTIQKTLQQAQRLVFLGKVSK
jgi:hypothetical protein